MKRALDTLWVLVAAAATLFGAARAEAGTEWHVVCRRRYAQAERLAYQASLVAERYARQRAAQQAAFQSGIRNRRRDLAMRACSTYNVFVDRWIDAVRKQWTAHIRLLNAARAYFRSLGPDYIVRRENPTLVASIERHQRDVNNLAQSLRELQDHYAKLSRIFADARIEVTGSATR